MINYIIFDLDDTICDYESAKLLAKKKINVFLHKRGINYKEFWVLYEKGNQNLFDDYTQNKISITEYRYERFNLFNLNEEEINYINNVYINTANVQIEKFPEVDSLFAKLQILRKKIVILTNGPSEG